MATAFVAYPDAYLYDKAHGKKKKIQHLIWGDWIDRSDTEDGAWVKVKARGEEGWLHRDSIQEERLLEVVFVDVGQGDGCLVVTPDDEHMVIDAGVDDSMARFLDWRYGGFRQPWRFKAGFVTHPDADHYNGFEDLFSYPNVSFDVLYHNGIMEYAGSESVSLGRKAKKGRRSYLKDLARDTQDLRDFLSDTSNWQTVSAKTGRVSKKQYARILDQGLQGGSFSDARMLSVADGYVPGFEENRELSIRVLGPVVEPVSASTGRLRWMVDKGKTKNGHSVVLLLEYRSVRLFLGGDLNIPSQELLLEHHTGLDPRPGSQDGRDALSRAAREIFQVDVAKACHHGAGDIATKFLAALNPLVTVISSGDDESHSHPRADALGATGRHSRGNRPLIFSTELARSSTNEPLRHPNVLKQQLKDLREVSDAMQDGSAKDKVVKRFNDIVDSLNRSVAVYGAIRLRSDGQRILLAQKLERPRGSVKWDLYQLEPQGQGADGAPGPLQFLSKYRD